MSNKIIYIIGVLAGAAFVILLVTAFMPFINGMAVDTANSTSVAAFASAQAGLRWTPLFLYLLPMVIVVAAIVLKLRSGGTVK